MAIGVKCPYCGEVGYTSSPQVIRICSYCKQEHDFPGEAKMGPNGKPAILTPGKKKDKNKTPDL